MNTAISLDTAGVKWPFVPQAQPQPQGRSSRAPTPTTTPVTVPAPASTLSDSASVSVSAPKAIAQPVVPASTGISGVYSDNLARARPMRRARVQEIGSGMFVHQAQTVGAMRRQMVGDVLLVAVWAVMIPAMLWLGHAAGF